MVSPLNSEQAPEDAEAGLEIVVSGGPDLGARTVLGTEVPVVGRGRAADQRLPAAEAVGAVAPQRGPDQHSDEQARVEEHVCSRRARLLPIIVFPDAATRPSFRLFNSWKAKGFLPFHKVGKRVFMDPEQVRLALDKQFLVKPSTN